VKQSGNKRQEPKDKHQRKLEAIIPKSEEGRTKYTKKSKINIPHVREAIRDGCRQ
jgi:hypothetical protein